MEPSRTPQQKRLPKEKQQKNQLQKEEQTIAVLGLSSLIDNSRGFKNSKEEGKKMVPFFLSSFPV
jgi:hypothetical protein